MMLDDHRLQLVEEQRLWLATDGREGSFEGLRDREGHLQEDPTDVQEARVAKHVEHRVALAPEK